ncbi:glutathione peroxidase 2-like [Lineus longissimus]|uniref:glutathione peroxidase 2-like n=1 Tax=Lineus longissimus TaxID=88925 RepID=UPI002B4D126D
MNNRLPTLPVQSPVKIDTLFNFSARLLGQTADGDLSRFRGKVILVVNIATHCERTTGELSQMNDLVIKFGNRLAVLAFPCNQFGHQMSVREDEILQTMKHIRPGNDFNPHFNLFAPVEVNGHNAHPIYEYLRKVIPIPSDDPLSLVDECKDVIWSPVTRSDVAWNFEKFLVTPEGRPFKRYSKKLQTVKITEDIKLLMKKFGISEEDTADSHPYNGLRC